MPINILMPALSPTMTQGTLAKWLVKEGEEVASGDIIAEIETDKATMEVEAVDEGTIAKLLIDEGSEGVAVNAIIAILAEEGEDAASLQSPETPAPSASPKDKPEASSEPDPQGASTDASSLEGDSVGSDAKPAASAPSSDADGDISPRQQAGKGTRLKASPLAKRIAAQKGLDLTTIDGSGPNGRIIKRDVEGAENAQSSTAPKATSDGASAAAPRPGMDGPTPLEAQRPSGIRKIIAQRLSESKFTSPHFYVTMDMELDALLALRKQINANPEELKVSVNDMLIMACGRALKAVPGANAGWVGQEIHQYLRADISVAVAADIGLVTPVVRGADTASLSQIAAKSSELVGKARDGKLKPEEMQGGSFSISNMGMMGVKQFTAIINPPQGAILAVGAGEKRPVVKNDELAIATVMTCTLSADHRVIDGALAAELIGKIKELVENPVRLLV